MKPLSMAQRRKTFPFDVLVVTVECEHLAFSQVVTLIRDKQTPEAQAKAQVSRMDTFNKDATKLVGFEEKVQRHPTKYVKCHNCEVELIEAVAVKDNQYYTPWEDKPTVRTYCSDWCRDVDTGSLYGGDFAFFDCVECHRQVCEQNPANGYMIQYRDREDGEKICLRCYEQTLLRDGLKREDFMGDLNAKGMFHNYDTLEDGGWEKKGGTLKLPDQGDIFQTLGQKLIDDGNKVIVNFERLAIGGIEGYVSIWFKKNRSRKTSKENT